MMSEDKTFDGGLMGLAKVKPSAAISFLRQRDNITTERHGELEAEAHARAFTSAGITEQRMLNRVSEALLRAQTEGKSFDTFQERFAKISAEHAWQPRNGVGNPNAINQRAFLIYQTNLSTAFSAGKWARLNTPEAIEMYPWFRYRHHTCQHPRLDHLAWDGLILPRDDPFWATHWAPNGWRCHCTIEAVSRRDMRKNGWSVSESPKIEWVEKRNPATGQMVRTPKGIDLGFAYNPGMVWQDNEARRAAHAVKPLETVGGVPKAVVPRPVLQQAQAEQIDALWTTKSGTAEAGTLPPHAQDILQKTGSNDITSEKALPLDAVSSGAIPVVNKAESFAPEWDGSVHISADTLNKARNHHPELEQSEYQHIPLILGNPVALVSESLNASGPGLGVIGRIGQQFYYATVRMKRGALAARLMRYHALSAADARRLMRRKALWGNINNDPK